ncbi:MAG: hypothetical protein AAGG08_07975 [Actinomycetota bacterium]
MELTADLTPDGLRDVLAELHERVAPTSLARERLLPVHEALRGLFVDGGLVRGRIHACSGSGGATMAMTIVRDAIMAGSWMALVDVPTFGADAADELGVPLERVVRVETGFAADHPGVVGDVSGATADDRVTAHGRRWLDVMAAAIDGFDVVMAVVPHALRGERSPAALRAMLARIQQRGAVVLLLGGTGVVPVDVEVASSGDWPGLGRGNGVIRGRRLHATASGRRQPRTGSCSIELTPHGRRVRITPAAAAAAHDVVDRAPDRSEHPAGRPTDPAAPATVRLVAG